MSYYINIPNKSHYISDTSAQSFRIINPETFTAKTCKQLGYYVRSYFEWINTTNNGGMTFFYTLTYNDLGLPKFNDIPCFNHDDLKMFMRSSGFDKQLLRNYGYTVKYLVTCELGDGKGSRGIANNPHYHVLFYLTPINRAPLTTYSNKVYKLLTPQVFMDIVRKYWCGHDYLLKLPQYYKHGIAMPGDNFGLVNSSSALRYVVKYVTKDINAINLYKKLKDSCYNLIWNYLTTNDKFLTKWKKYIYDNQLTSSASKDYLQFIADWSYEHFYLKKIRNKHVPKVKISQGLGLYGLSQINDSGLSITLPQSTSKIMSCGLPMYYYRKMYYKVVKDAKGNNKYVLNDKGVDIKVSNLDRLLTVKYNDLSSIFNAFDVDYTPQILQDYCLYDLVYRNRTCPNFDVDIDKYNDYRQLLISDFYKSSYLSEDDATYKLILNKTFFPLYKYHSYFLPYVKYFEKFDDFLESFYIWQDNHKYEQFTERNKVRKEHAINKFNRKYYL